MKEINLFLIIFILPLWAISQRSNISLLYNDKGQFRPDTSLRISMSQYKMWKAAELKIYLDCGHDLLAGNLKREIAKNKFNKRNIISFDCDSGGISNIVYVKKYTRTWDGDGIKEDLNEVKKNRKEFFQYFKEVNKEYFNDTLQYYGKYYISL